MWGLLDDGRGKEEMITKLVKASFKCRCGAVESIFLDGFFDRSYPVAWGSGLCTKCYDEIFGRFGLNGRKRVKGRPDQPQLVEIIERRLSEC